MSAVSSVAVAAASVSLTVEPPAIKKHQCEYKQELSCSVCQSLNTLTDICVVLLLQKGNAAVPKIN